MLNADEGCDSAVRLRQKLDEHLPVLTGKGFSLKLKGKVRMSCLRSCLIYGSETWPIMV